MSSFSAWLRQRKSVASTAAIAVLAGVPLGFAVLHQGFPVTDPDLQARDVWVTNGEDLLAGRLNRQIDELDASVATVSKNTDVFQNGDDAFVFDPDAGSIERIDPSFTTLGQRIDVPPGSRVAYGGDIIALLAPTGELWRVQAAAELSFDYRTAEPIAKLTGDAQVAVSSKGTVFASAPDGTLVTFERGTDAATTTEIAKVGEHQLTAVGETPVVLELERSAVVVDGDRFDLPETGVRIQQSGAENNEVFVASADSLLAISLDNGEVRTMPSGAENAADQVAAPVWLDGCAHAAWSGSGRYLLACDGADTQPADIEQPTAGAELEFRVNRSVIVLNNLTNGNAWLVDSELHLVDNWEEVTPPEESDDEEGDEKTSEQTFEDTLAERTDVNRSPIARDDEYGVRPGRTTILEMLENDTDPDGDVLTIASTSAVSEAAGTLEYIDGGRALQFTPAENAAGSVSFRYTVTDGRGGVAEANVNVRVVPMSENSAPTSMRTGSISLEQGQQLSYNVLTDFVDPDGDDLYLVNAAPTSGDNVRFSPDGYVTFEHRSAELGKKEVQFTVSDGQTSASGTLKVEVQKAGSLNPIGVPDFQQVFSGERVQIEPLANDLTPSGAPIELLGTDEPPAGTDVAANLERGTVSFRADTAGDYQFMYQLGAGAKTSIGLIRIEVIDPPSDRQPPIAVTDTAYLRAGEPLSVPVLANDVSPSGRVLAIQSVDASEAEGLVSVEILTNTVTRVTASQALDEQLQFSYTISDGIETATSTVTIVPVPELVKHQPPVARADTATVRAGDIVSVHVLENDFHPDASAIHVNPKLATGDDFAGLAFVDDELVRYQAPDEPGTYALTYSIDDDFEQSAKAKLTFTVAPKNIEENRAPLPGPVTSRTFAGSAVKIDIPLDGIDPDGDSVVLTGISAPPSLGRIVDRTSTSITYEAFAGSTGTDTITYALQDPYGASSKGTIRIGVIPRPPVQLPPKAIDDSIEMKPGRTASVEVLLNDSDPSGYELSVTDLPDIDDGIEAEIDDRRRVIVTAPETEGAYTIRYELSNGHGGADAAFVQIAVTDDAIIQPPTAEDQIIEPEQVLNGEPVTVRPLQDATNPGGLVEDLVVTTEGPNAGRGDVTSDGRITVEPGTERYAVAYRLTNELDDLSAMAFVIVPPKPGGPNDEMLTAQELETPEPTDPAETEKPKTPEELAAEERAKFPPPHLKDLGEIVVPMNGSIEWSIDELVAVPSGNPALVLNASATSMQTDPMVDGTNLRYVPETDFRGEATLTFEVTDGTSADDPIGRRAILSVPIIVGDAEFNDTPPTFTPRSITIEANEKPVEVDLRSSSYQPNPENIEKIRYEGLAGATTDISAELVDGATLVLQSPFGVQPGAETRITFDVKFNEFTVPGYIDVKVVSSSKPFPKLKNDGEFEMVRGETKTFDVLANDFNPFAQDGKPLRVIDAEIDLESAGSKASVSHTSTGVSVTTSAAFTGNLSIDYRVADATNDPVRERSASLNIVVRDRPDKPAQPAEVGFGNKSATIKWRAPATNRSPITGYVVKYGGTTKEFGANADGANHTFTGLTNGKAYTFSVQAINGIGKSSWSPGQSVTPYGTPGKPSVKATARGYAKTTLDVDWSIGSTGGGGVTYQVKLNKGGWKSVGSSTSTTFRGVGAGTHTVYVKATNRGSGKTGSTGADNVGVQTKPIPPPSGTIYKADISPNSCSGCRWVGIDVSNFTAGNYRITTFINGGHSGLTENTYSVSANGSVVIWNSLGIRNNDAIKVRFTSVSTGKVYWSNTTRNWDSLPVRGGRP